MIKAKKTTIEKFGQKFILINPEKDISIEKLCSLFGLRTIKVNHFNSNFFEIVALNGLEEHFNIEEIRNSIWEDIKIN